MLGLVEQCFPDSIEAWRPRLAVMVPSYGTQLSDDVKLAASTIASTAKELQIAP
jgi:malate dehydrogenase (quinone)